MVQISLPIKEKLIGIIEDLPVDRMTEVLDFALFIKTQQIQQQSSGFPQPVQHLEDLWGDFWPEDQPVDEFIDAVRWWRHEDLALHKDLCWS